MRKLLDFLFGFILGALMGAAIAMLLAPEAGETTRSQIQLRIQDVIDEGKRAAADRRAELESELEQLKQGKSLEEVQPDA
jgi:gas vesicle protein